MGFSMVKKILFLGAASLGLFVYASETVPANNNFSEWQNFNQELKNWKELKRFPANWEPLDRADRKNTISRGKDGGIVLDGMIRTKRFSLVPNSNLEIRVNAESAKGSLKVYLFSYFSKEDKYFQQCGYVMKLEKQDIRGEYIKTIQTGAQGQSWFELALDGFEVTVKDVQLRILPKVEKKFYPPVLSIPLVSKSPVIDGIFRHEDWQNALRMFQPFRSLENKGIVLSGEEICLSADKEALYLLIRSPKNIAKVNECTKRDGEVHLDDSLEIVIKPEEATDRLFHITANFKGTIFDEERAVGQNFIEWNCKDLVVKTGCTDDFSVIAMKIPFASVNIKEPSKGWRFNLCRNYPDWIRFSSFSGAGYFIVPQMMYGKVTDKLSSLTYSTGFDSDKFVFFMNPSGIPGQFFWQVKENGGSNFEKNILFKGNGVAASVSTSTINERNGDFESILKLGDEVLFHIGTQYSENEKKNKKVAEKIKFSEFKYYPIQKKAAVILKDLAFSEQRKIGKIFCTVTGSDQKKNTIVFPAQTLMGNSSFASAPFVVPKDGEYTWDLTVCSNDGSVMENNSGTFHAQKDFAWVDNQYGKERIVIPPFTDLKVDNDTVSCTLRDYKFGKNGLPEQILARGKNILSAPISLNVLTEDDKVMTFSGKNFRLISTEKDRVEFESELFCGNLKGKMTAWMEYDGMVFYTMILEAPVPERVKRIYLSIPYDDATYFHVSGTHIRGTFPNFYRTEDLPGKGVIWRSSQYLPVNKWISGSFLPNVWLGSLSAGLTFFAESDKDWINSKSSSCYNLVRSDNGKLELQVNFVSKKTTLSGKRTIEFGLIANPFKEKICNSGANESLSWQTTFGRQFFNIGLMPIDGFISSLMINGEQKTSYLPYTCGNEYPYGDPEYKAAAEEFDLMLKRSYNSWEESQKSRRTGGLNDDDYLGVVCSWNKYRTDFMVWRMYHLMTTLPVDGIYLDNSYVQYSNNPLTVDQGFFKEDGTLQAKFNMLAERDFLKRVAVISYLNKKRKPAICIHNTGSMLASFSFGDIFMDGEMDIPETHYEVFSRAWDEVMLAADWGLVPGRLTMITGSADKKKNDALFSIFKLYDMKFWITHSGLDLQLYRTLSNVEKNFGTTEKDCCFTGYWQNTGIRFVQNDKDILASCFTRPKGKLIYMTNRSEVTKTVSFNLPDDGVLTDIREGGGIVPNNGYYTVTITPHNFKCLLYAQNK